MERNIFKSIPKQSKRISKADIVSWELVKERQCQYCIPGNNEENNWSKQWILEAEKLLEAFAIVCSCLCFNILVGKMDGLLRGGLT